MVESVYADADSAHLVLYVVEGAKALFAGRGRRRR
jgi:hypothetical protein